MGYIKPHIDETGIHIPLYTEIRDYLLEQACGIFGDDLYLENDSQDYQLICAFAEKMNDVNELAMQVYNNRGPLTSIGSGLDGVVKLNGIKRKEQTHSICPVIISGNPGTKIYNGIVKDTNDEKWNIGNVVIPESGQIEVMATCRSAGPVYADANTIIRIVTQTQGWLSVTNQVNATPGREIEADAILRSRQAISTANPSKTVMQGILGGIAAILNVTRYRGYENDTNVPDKHGIPGHSISFVVEGGQEEEIAQVIYLRKTPGSGTYGDVEVQIEDSTLEQPPIRFFRPKYINVFVQISVHPFPGFVSQTPVDIQKNICDYLNSIRIGEKLTVSALYVPAMAATPNIAAPLFSIQQLIIGKSSSDMSINDMDIKFNEVTRGILDHIQVSITE